MTIMLLVSIVLFSCTQQPEATQGFQIKIPDNLSKESKDIINKAFPKVKMLAPGLDKYESSLKFEGIEDDFDYAPKNAQRVSIKFSIPEDSKGIPAEYNASGHKCELNITRDGQLLLIYKNACKSVFLDKQVRGTQYDIEPLSLKL